jgi:hypothetical protein
MKNRFSTEHPSNIQSKYRDAETNYYSYNCKYTRIFSGCFSSALQCRLHATNFRFIFVRVPTKPIGKFVLYNIGESSVPKEYRPIHDSDLRHIHLGLYFKDSHKMMKTGMKFE